MKRRYDYLAASVFFSIVSIASLCGLTGCQSWPKDAYIQDAESTVNTPWGPSTFKAGIIATGSAAKTITLPENAETSSTKTTKAK